jgi:ABC-type glycerol-3-phosphate transport system substrate-binding protein
MAGITLRGGPALWHPLYGVIRSYGGGYFDSDWNPIINHPKSIEGAKMYAELCKYTPKGITSYDWDEINTAMLAGEAAMFMDSSVIYPRLNDPEKSTVVGKIKVAPYPRGPAGRIAHCHYWSVSIAESSQKKEAAWLFLEWVTSKDVMYKAGLKGVLPPRASVWDEPAFRDTFPEDFIISVQETLKTGVISPAHSRFFEAMDILRAEFQKVLLGEKDVESALDFTQREWEKIMSDWKATR